MQIRLLLVPLLAVAACAPRRIHEEPILRSGDRIESSDPAVERARMDAQKTQREATARRDELAANALANCAPAVCAAIARGEVALGMTETQLLAATHTTEGAWNARDAGTATVMVPLSFSNAPHDAAGELAMVQLRDGRVATYSYHDAAGIRVISNPQQATTEGRASETADMMLREGDDYTSRGDLKSALDRYDRAQILRPNSPIIDYRIATVLDKELRPMEAQIRYQLFLHRMEIEKIEATGRANGYLADAIAQARQRVIILEKQNK